MKIDLDHLTTEQIVLFNSNIDKALNLYNEMSSNLLKRCDELRWYVNNVTSRNTVFSPSLLCIRNILLLKEIEKTHTIEEVVVSNYEIAYVLRQKYVVNCPVTPVAAFLKRYKKAINSIGFTILWSLGAIRCKSKKRVDDLKREGADIGIDIFKENNSYEDRYYGNALDSLPKEVQRRCFYQAIYLLIPQKKNIEAIVKNTKYKLVYLWDFLLISDYLSALWNSRRKFPISLMRYEIEGFDMSHLLKSVSDDSATFYFFLAHLYVKVIKGMKRSGLDLHLCIDWFENQSFDKSTYWAMNMYYPEIPVHAYIGFMADTKVNPITIATNEELNCHIAPQHIFVCNEALKQQYLKSGYKGKVVVAPYYRSQKVWSLKRKEKSRVEPYQLFVPLGIFMEEVMYKSKLIVGFLKDYPDMDIHVAIKMHPSNDSSILKPLLGDEKRIEIVEGDFYEHLSKADAVVASNSSTTYEALSCGIPALYLMDPDNNFCLNRPEGIDDKMWYVIDNSESFNCAISTIRNIPFEQLVKMGNSIKAYYFQPVDDKLTRELFLLD